MVLVLLGVLFALAGIFALYTSRETPLWLAAGVVLLVIAVILIFLGVNDGSSEVNALLVTR